MWPTMLLRIVVLALFAQNFARPFETGEGFAELRPDVDDADDRRYQKCEQRHKFHIFADGELTAQDLAGADVHDQRTHHAHNHSRG